MKLELFKAKSSDPLFQAGVLVWRLHTTCVRAVFRERGVGGEVYPDLYTCCLALSASPWGPDAPTRAVFGE